MFFFVYCWGTYSPTPSHPPCRPTFLRTLFIDAPPPHHSTEPVNPTLPHPKIDRLACKMTPRPHSHW